MYKVFQTECCRFVHLWLFHFSVCFWCHSVMFCSLFQNAWTAIYNFVWRSSKKKIFTKIFDCLHYIVILDSCSYWSCWAMLSEWKVSTGLDHIERIRIVTETPSGASDFACVRKVVMFHGWRSVANQEHKSNITMKALKLAEYKHNAMFKSVLYSSHSAPTIIRRSSFQVLLRCQKLFICVLRSAIGENIGDFNSNVKQDEGIRSCSLRQVFRVHGYRYRWLWHSSILLLCNWYGRQFYKVLWMQ